MNLAPVRKSILEQNFQINLYCLENNFEQIFVFRKLRDVKINYNTFQHRVSHSFCLFKDSFCRILSSSNKLKANFKNNSGSTYLESYKMKVSQKWSICERNYSEKLIRFSRMFHFYTHWKCRETKGFLTFSGAI